MNLKIQGKNDFQPCVLYTAKQLSVKVKQRHLSTFKESEVLILTHYLIRQLSEGEHNQTKQLAKKEKVRIQQ